MSDTTYFVVPGSLEARTGGYAYDRHIIEGLRKYGLNIDPIELGGDFPNPDQGTRIRTEKLFASLPDGAVAVVDGLAFGALPEIAEIEHKRLKLVALVHHPLADETGLTEDRKVELARSEKRALEIANHVIVTSGFTLERLVELGFNRKKISIVEPGVVPAPLVLRVGLPRKFLCPASYIPRKGHADLLHALAGLTEHSWQLVCVGNPDLDARCYKKICALNAELGLTEKVELRAEVEDGELDRLYASTDFVVLASHYEGFGMVVTEAIARGLPVITTTGGALAQTLPKGAGLSSPPGKIETLQKNLHQALTDEDVYSGLCAGAKAARGNLASWEEASRAFAAALSL